MKSCILSNILVLLLSGQAVPPCPAGGATEPRVAAASPREEAPAGMESWLNGRAWIEIRNESNGKASRFEAALHRANLAGSPSRHELSPLSLEAIEHFAQGENRMVWTLELTGSVEQAGHEVVIDLPVLTQHYSIFTPSERGEMSLAQYPDFEPVPYGHAGYSTNRFYVLPLVSVFDSKRDRALTVALRPDGIIPHFQVQWMSAGTLRLRLSHRALGEACPSSIELLFYTHPADYRAVLKAYSDDFPRYFQPALPRGEYEGAFWYHHIHSHPPFPEMVRQNIRFTWMSFWFTFLGEYLPPGEAWHPYTYARWWKLEEGMSDRKIRTFIREMHDHGIGAFAYFNLTEYGGAGGVGGDVKEAERLLEERFADALMLDAEGRPIRTWEGALAMNVRPDCSLYPELAEQLRRHLERLPELDGFIVDRLDWASRYDFGHGDGRTMIKDRPVQAMAEPVRAGMAEVCRQAHGAGKRVYCNQFWRIEMLRDVDGYCNESDNVFRLGFLAPFRPVSAWHKIKPYDGDLLHFEAQLKRRLQFAVHPQMIARTFPIAQQPPDPEAADMLELYAPLFDALDGKKQVLIPHCVSVSGANDVNLFTNRNGCYVLPVTSRVRFLTRCIEAVAAIEEVVLRLRVPDAAELAWAHVVSADGPGRRANISQDQGALEITVPGHGTASMVIVGKGAEPPLPDGENEDRSRTRDRLCPPARAADPNVYPCPVLGEVKKCILHLTGNHLAAPGTLTLSLGEETLGPLQDGRNPFELDPVNGRLPDRPLEITVATGDTGTWYRVEEIDLYAVLASGKVYQVAGWTPDRPPAPTGSSDRLRYTIPWCPPKAIERSWVRFVDRNIRIQGAWRGKFGALGVWIPDVIHGGSENTYRVVSEGTSYTWAKTGDDPRVLEPPDDSSSDRSATCWYGQEEWSIDVTPPDRKLFHLTVYAVDYDRDGRAMEVRLEDGVGDLDRRIVTRQEMDQGIYLTWTVSGPLKIIFRKSAGTNVVASGIFLD